MVLKRRGTTMTSKGKEVCIMGRASKRGGMTIKAKEKRCELLGVIHEDIKEVVNMD
jgi:hypothetical protein